MFGLLALLFPAFLLLLLLAMERVEAPLRSESVGHRLGEFLNDARPDEVEVFVSQGLAPALDRYWKRRSLRAHLSARRLVTRNDSR